MASTEDQHLQGSIVPSQRAPRPIEAGTTIGHVHLRTSDIDRIRGFCVAGLHHVAIRYPTRAGLADALRRLQAVDWPLRQCSDHGTHEAIYISDPDGNDLELCWDRPFDEWPRNAEGKVDMSQAFQGDLDLEDLLMEPALS